ncbi:formyltransferase family protein [Candidatus Omnitrophota bacterium]
MLNICFMGAKQAGIIGALTILAKGNQISAAVSYSADLTGVLDSLGVPVYKSIADQGFVQKLRHSDVFFSVHGREIVPAEFLRLPKYGAVNVHPYLYKYKGADPIQRALKDQEFKGSVGAHLMQQGLDQGEILTEEFVDVTGSQSVADIYQRLYPFYSTTILKALDIISQRPN